MNSDAPTAPIGDEQPDDSARRVNVAIVAWNARDLTERCLGHLLDSEGVTLDVTVVDNGSREPLSALQARFPGVRFLRSERNLGFAAGSNLALRDSSGGHALLLNPDCFVETTTIATMAHCLDRHERAGAVGPRLTYADGTLQYSTYRDVTPATLLWEYVLLDHRFPNHRLAGRSIAADYERPRTVDGVLGACLLVRGTAAAEVGLLDERYAMYCEEVDWCRRLRAAGWEVRYEPAARAVHLGGALTGTVYGPMFHELHRSRFQLYACYETSARACLMRTITRVGLAYQLVWGMKELLRGRLTWGGYRRRLRTFRRVLFLPAPRP